MWILFQMKKRPYYDRHGNVLSSIEGRYNRFGIDEFFGGGWIRPDFTGYTVLREFRNDADGRLLVEVKEDATALTTKDQALKAQTAYRVKMQKGRKIFEPYASINFNFKDFQPKALTDFEVENLLRSWGKWVEPPESGVTD